MCIPLGYHRQDQHIVFPIEGKFLLHAQKCKGRIMSIEPFDDLQGEADCMKKVEFQMKDVTNNKVDLVSLTEHNDHPYQKYLQEPSHFLAIQSIISAQPDDFNTKLVLDVSDIIWDQLQWSIPCLWLTRHVMSVN